MQIKILIEAGSVLFLFVYDFALLKSNLIIDLNTKQYMERS